MELALTDLNEVIDNGHIYENQELIYVLKSILHSLHVLENHGIVHRDIKPKNILIFKQGDKIYYKLWDLGCGYLMNEGDKLIPMGTINGFSNDYASPEVLNIKDKTNYNPYQADIFSLGLTVLSMMGVQENHFIRLKKEEISVNEIKESIELTRQYHVKIWEMLKIMLSINPSERKTFQELENMISSAEVDNQNENFSNALNFKFNYTLDVNTFREQIKIFEFYFFDIHIEKIYKQALKRAKSIMRLIPFQIKNTMEEVEYLLCKAILSQDSKRYYEKAIEIMKKTNKTKEFNYLIALKGLASYFMEGNIEESLRLNEKLLKKSQKKGRIGLTSNTAIQIFESHLKMGNIEQAKKSWKDSFQYFAKVFENFKLEIYEDLWMKTNIFDLKINFQKMDEMFNLVKMERFLLNNRENLVGKLYFSLAGFCEVMTEIYNSINQRENALFFAKKTLRIRKSLLGNNNNYTKNAFNILAELE